MSIEKIQRVGAAVLPRTSLAFLVALIGYGCAAVENPAKQAIAVVGSKSSVVALDAPVVERDGNVLSIKATAKRNDGKSGTPIPGHINLQFFGEGKFIDELHLMLPPDVASGHQSEGSYNVNFFLPSVNCLKVVPVYAESDIDIPALDTGSANSNAVGRTAHQAVQSRNPAPRSARQSSSRPRRY